MTSKDSFVFSQKDLAACYYTMFYDMKKKEELIDVYIKIDNMVYAAHRVVLAAAIPYFRKIFTNHFAESTEKELTLEELEPAALECLIDFAYTNEVEITVENVQSLLAASEYLQMTKVRDSCCDFLSKRFDPNNVMNVRALADSLNCVNLVENADSYIKKNFDAFSQAKEFLSLSFSFLNDLIRKDDLDVSSEEKVFDAVMNWVKTDAKRQNMLPDLLTGVRMTFLSPQFLVKKASKEKLIMNSVPCRNILDEAKHFHLLPEEGASACSFKVSVRCFPEEICGIYLFCSNETSGLTIFKHTATTRKWSTVLNDKSRSDVQHVLSVANEIYVFRSNAFETFNPRTLAWTLKVFPGKYSNFSQAISCNGKIYWFGCKSAFSGMCFDSQRNLWVSYEHENLELFCDDELVPNGNTVYVLGPHSSRGGLPIGVIVQWNLAVSYLVLYNLQTQTVSNIPELQNKRKSCCGTVLGDTLYVCGGIRQHLGASSFGFGTVRYEPEVLRSTETYSSSRGWQTTSSMNKPRKNFSLLTYEEELYAIGGTADGSDLVEVYNPAADTWTLISSSLDGNYNSVKGVVISGGKKKPG